MTSTASPIPAIDTAAASKPKPREIPSHSAEDWVRTAGIAEVG
jgi:hypothetical protein